MVIIKLEDEDKEIEKERSRLRNQKRDEHRQRLLKRI